MVNVDLKNITNDELRGCYTQTVNEISKYKNLQLAKKIALNSAYGALANRYFRFYNHEIAESITVSGQLSIRWIARKLNEYINKLLNTQNKDYVIAVDTDSVYLNMEPVVNKFFSGKSKEQIVDLLDKIWKEKIDSYIEKSYSELAEYMNAFGQKMFMKRESIADTGIWTAKKRYILNVLDSEGVRYNIPKLKIMGIEAVRSSTPLFCRGKIKECLNIIMTGTEDELIKFLDSVRKDFNKLQPEEIGSPRSVNNLSTYSNKSTLYKKGCPIHVRGSLLFNSLLEKHKLQQSYTQIHEGEKIKYLYLKEPNVIRENVIAFPLVLPREFNLHAIVDYDTQFNKTFLAPLSMILDAIGWRAEKKSTLDSFFE